MRIRLLRKYATSARSYPVGTILTLSDTYAKKIIDEGKAVEYTGTYPPEKKNKKMKFDLKNLTQGYGKD